MLHHYQKPLWLYQFVLGVTLCFVPILASSNEDQVCVKYEDENKDGCFCVKRPSPLVPGGYGRRITCHAVKDTTTFPTDLPPSTIQLDLSNNRLAGRLTANSLSKLPYLQKLDLQGNDISFIEDKAFILTPHLEVLDLSRNRLRSIQRHTFTGLKKLEKLKLNDNQIQTLEEGSFEDVIKLGKLDLSDNSLVCDCSLSWFIIWTDTRPNLIANPSKLKCALPIKFADAHLRKINPEDMRCADQAHKERVNLKHKEKGQRIDGLDHGRTNNAVNNQIGMLEILPDHHQTVFGGDSLKLSCKAQLTKSHKISWRLKGRLVDEEESNFGDDLAKSLDRRKENLLDKDIAKRDSKSGVENVTITSLSYHGNVEESTVHIHKIAEPHSGEWACAIGNLQQKSINIIVITSSTKVCSPQVSKSPRGMYHWGAAIGGHTLQLPCEKPINKEELGHGKNLGLGYNLCLISGEWSSTANTSQCAYTSPVTDALHKFATMNTSFFNSETLLQSAKHILNFTQSPAIFKDPMDVVYFSEAVENYLPYLNQPDTNKAGKRPLFGGHGTDNNVGHYMIDMISNILGVSPDLMELAQRRGLACKRLLGVVQNVTSTVSSFKHQSADGGLAIESFQPSPSHFGGLTCTWYSTDTPAMTVPKIRQRFTPKRVFHCAQSNKTLPSQGKKILASLVVPVTLYQQLKRTGLGERLDMTSRRTPSVHLTFAAYSNASLFPSTKVKVSSEKENVINSGIHDHVETFVIGATLGDFGNFNLTEEPVYVVIRDEKKNIKDPLRRRIQPLWWDPFSNGGLGSWTSEHCHLISSRSNLVWFSCTRLGYYAYNVLLESSPQNGVSKHKIQFGDEIYQTYIRGHHHPIVHIASSVASFLLLPSILIYGTCHQAIHSSRTLKHSLPNICTCFVWILLFFTTGIHQTQHRATCRSVGLISHFLSISSILWILVSVHVVYKKSSSFRKFRDGYPQNTERTAREKRRKPVTRLYLFCYGASTVLVAISAAVDIKHYDGYNYCFLSFTSFVWAALIPVTLGILVILGIVFATICLIFTHKSPSHVREQQQTFDMDMIGPHSRLNPNTGSILSLSSLHLPDAEKTTKSLLAAYVSLLLLFISTWTFGALSVVQPFDEARESQQEVVFGVMFAMSSVSLSLFVLVYFCASRNDVQECFKRLPGLFRAAVDTNRSPKLQPFSSYNVPENVQTMETLNSIHQPMAVAITSNLPTNAQPLFQESQQIHGTHDLNYGLHGARGQLLGTNELAGELRPFLAPSENVDKQYTLPNLQHPPQLSMPFPDMDPNHVELFYGTSDNAVGIRTTGYSGGTGIVTSNKSGSVSRTASNVASTASRARIKVNSMFGGGNKHGIPTQQKDSDMSSDHLSVNNVNHLRRGYVAPVNSEAEYSLAGGSIAPTLPPPPPPPPLVTTGRTGMFGQFPNTNVHAESFASHSIQSNREGYNCKDFQIGKQPKTSSPTAGHPVPFTDQDLTVSPLINVNRDTLDPYAMMPVTDHISGNPQFCNSNLEGNSSLTNDAVFMNLSGDSNIRVGDPCQIMSYATADLPSGMSSVVPSSIYGSPYPTNFASRFNGMPPPGFIGSSGKSASLPRRPLYPKSDRKHGRHRNTKVAEDVIMRLSDVEDDSKSTGRYSAVSMGSTAYSSRSGHSAKTKKNRDRPHKRPNKRRHRKQSNNDNNANPNVTRAEASEPFYNNLESVSGRGKKSIPHRNPEDEYLGDHDCDGDQFDSLECVHDKDEVANSTNHSKDSINPRNVCTEPLIEQSETEGHKVSTSDVAKDESEEHGPSSTSQYSSHSHFSSSDIPKRETSV